jgi:DNA-binding XRE family transcriptional regulator
VQTPPNPLEKQLARFLREQRGTESYARFAKKLGTTASTLFRLENLQQSASLKLVHQITTRLKVSLSDIFGK